MRPKRGTITNYRNGTNVQKRLNTDGWLNWNNWRQKWKGTLRLIRVKVVSGLPWLWCSTLFRRKLLGAHACSQAKTCVCMAMHALKVASTTSPKSRKLMRCWKFSSAFTLCQEPVEHSSNSCCSELLPDHVSAAWFPLLTQMAYSSTFRLSDSHCWLGLFTQVHSWYSILVVTWTISWIMLYSAWFLPECSLYPVPWTCWTFSWLLLFCELNWIV